MHKKTVEFIKNQNIYQTLAERNMEKGKYELALSHLFSALLYTKNPYEIYGDIADAYSVMGQYEKAVEFWFKYINTAPENKISVAYEELAVNFFYQDKMFEAGYYFHKKILADGVVSREGLGEDISEFLSSSNFDKSAYHIAYPYNRADFSFEKKHAKRLFNLGDYKGSAKFYDKIPPACMDEESFGEQAVANFLQGEDEKTLEACKQSLKRNGENITAFCNLSTYYYNKGDYENSAYYYNKALSCFDKSYEQCYQIASCSIEQADHLTASYCLSKINEERRYDVVMRLYYGIALVNTGNFQRAFEEFAFALRLTPTDRVLEFYCNLAKDLREGKSKAGEFLPLKYNKEYPDKIIKSFKKTINDLINEKTDLSVLKSKDKLDALYWGIYCTDEKINKECAILLWFAKNIGGAKILTDFLMDMEVRSGVKRVIIYTLIIFGYDKRFGVVAGTKFKKIKRGKLAFNDDEENEIFASAYASIVARTAFWEIDADKKFVDSINYIYKKHSLEVKEQNISAEELAVITICTAKVPELKNEIEVSNMFGVKYPKIKQLINTIKGETL